MTPRLNLATALEQELYAALTEIMAALRDYPKGAFPDRLRRVRAAEVQADRAIAAAEHRAGIDLAEGAET